MGNTAQAEEAKAGTEGQDKWAESYTVRVAGLNEFYRLVRGLNRQLGHGNWTIRGRVLKRIKRIDKANQFAASFPNMVGVNLMTGEITTLPVHIHTQELTIWAPVDSASAISTAMFDL